MDNVCPQTDRDAKVADMLETRGNGGGRNSLRSALVQAYEYALHDLQLAQVYRARAGLESDPLNKGVDNA